MMKMLEEAKISTKHSGKLKHETGQPQVSVAYEAYKEREIMRPYISERIIRTYEISNEETEEWVAMFGAIWLLSEDQLQMIINSISPIPGYHNFQKNSSTYEFLDNAREVVQNY